MFLKREDLQPIFSFKLRGAYNKVAHLTEEQRKRGIVACSAGNHAQGVAMSAAKLDIDAVIVMPVATPMIKVRLRVWVGRWVWVWVGGWVGVGVSVCLHVCLGEKVGEGGDGGLWRSRPATTLKGSRSWTWMRSL